MIPINNKYNNNTERHHHVHDLNLLLYRSLIDREVYDYYRENRRRQSKTIDQYNYFVKAVEGLFRVISEMIAQSEGGVYIEGLGYFCCIKKVVKNRSESLTLRGRKKISYVPFFFPDKAFEDWRMEGTFKFFLKNKIKEAKVKHNIYFDVCESYREAATQARIFTNNKYKK